MAILLDFQLLQWNIFITSMFLSRVIPLVKICFLIFPLHKHKYILRFKLTGLEDSHSHVSLAVQKATIAMVSIWDEMILLGENFNQARRLKNRIIFHVWAVVLNKTATMRSLIL